MELKELRYILELSKNKNISKAAKALYISQPSLSIYIQNLENRLGLKLFNRAANQFVLTYAGECYVQAAKRIIEISEQLDEQLFNIANNKTGQIKVAFPLIRGAHILPAVIPAFKKKYPNIDIAIVAESDSQTLEGLILNGEAEVALLHLPLRNANIDFIHVKKEMLLLIAPYGHPLARHGVREKNAKYPWIDIKL